MEHTTSRVDRVEPRPTLAGRVSRRLLLLLLIGDILGAGIYVLVGEVAAEAGAMMWLPFAVAFVIAMLSAVSYAELVTRYPGAAGSALYARRAFGSPTLTAVVGTAVLASTVTTSATTARAFAGDYLSAFVDLPEVVVAVGLIALLTVVATLGIETSARANATLTGVEAFGLLLVVAVGVAVLAGGEVDPRPLADPGPLTLGAVISATALAFFAFIGFEDAVHLSEEVDDPQRTFPMVMVAAVAVTGVIYLLIAVLSAMVVAPSVLAASDGPLLEVIHAGPLPIPDRVFAAIALGAVTNTSLFALVAAARLIYGMAADGDLPPALAATSNRGSPTRAAILVGSLAAVAAATGAVGALASTTVTALLAVLLVVNVAAIRTRHETGGWRPAPWMAWVGAATTGGLLLFQLFNLDQAGAIRLLALVGLGALGRLARPRGRSGGPRPDAAERATTNRHKPSTTTVIEPTARLSCGGGLPG